MSGEPSKDFTNLIQLGLKAKRLAADDPAVLARLPAGFLDAVASEVTSLESLATTAMQAHRDATNATASQSAALLAAFEIVAAIRVAARESSARPDVKRAYGVGKTVDKRVVSHLIVATNVILERATKNPAEAASLGIVEADLATLRRLVATIQSANLDRERHRASAPSATRARNAAARRLLASVRRVAAAGILEYASDPDRRTDFAHLLASHPRS